MRTTLTLSPEPCAVVRTNAQWVDIPDPNVLGFGQSDVFYFIDDQVGFAAVNGCRIARTADGARPGRWW